MFKAAAQGKLARLLFNSILYFIVFLRINGLWAVIRILCLHTAPKNVLDDTAFVWIGALLGRSGLAG